MAVQAERLGAAPRELFEHAAAVLRRNDLGGRTKAAPKMYPHQWSWDCAFIAIGLAHLDPVRAATELSSLFDKQWANGKVPHIVFDPDAPEGDYWPGSRHWICVVPDDHPPGVVPNTSGLFQPPVHAVAAERIWQIAQRQGGEVADDVRAWLAGLYPKLLAWHRYLHTARDPEGSGLVTIYHPWASGLDNSPRWDEPLGAVSVDERVSFARVDLNNVADPSERPSDESYRRFAALIQELRAHCYDDRVAQYHQPFRVKDVLLSGILVAADRALLRIAEAVGGDAGERDELQRWWERGQAGMLRSFHAEDGLAADYDVHAGRWVRTRTLAGFAPLVAGVGRDDVRHRQLETLRSESFLGHPALRWPLPPSTSPTDPGFNPRSYWRGPVWPVMNWLLWWALGRLGEHDLADELRAASMEQLAATGTFPEYVHPFTGEGLGAVAQSWTAAVTLDWLATDHRPDPDR